MHTDSKKKQIDVNMDEADEEESIEDNQVVRGNQKPL